ncbi:MAG: sulfotransferase family 2 domain-containing protein [Phycisphaeraceae bacterium]|nr:MAG: sulfotransferase family 2 domain-containing protein [Phycisphaeraceae bacterium]
MTRERKTNPRSLEGPAAPLVYVHIPKAAGTTLKNLLAEVYKPRPVIFFTPRTGELEQVRALPANARRQIAVLAGHEPFGYQDLFRGCRVTPAVITVLREPVARVVSLFRYIHRDPEHPRHAEFVEKGVTLEQVYGDLHLPAFDNHMTRFLAGRRAFNKPFGLLTGEDLEQAERNLASGCRAFGLQERFDDSIAWFARELNWPAAEAGDHNRATRRSRSSDVADSDRTLIARHNELDARLYEFACGLFDERVS